MSGGFRIALVVVVWLVGHSAHVELRSATFAQSCDPSWSNQFADGFFEDGEAYVVTMFDDDGDGPNPPMLYAGGTFRTAGGAYTLSIAKWTGTRWASVGGGTNGTVSALAVYDEDGTGPMPAALYVGGEFSEAGGQVARNIAKWDGTVWSPVGGGVDDDVLTLLVVEGDGGGPRAAATGSQPSVLYVGGNFEAAGGVAAAGIAQWNGTSWSPVGDGVSLNVIRGRVSALTLFDDDGDGPHGPELFAGGYFTEAGGVAAASVAKWDGQSWSSLGTVITSSGEVFDLTVFDEDGAGPNAPALFAGGTFRFSGDVDASFVARWNGTEWSDVPGGATGGVIALSTFDEDGAGPQSARLFVGTRLSGLHVWDGTAWSEPSQGPFAGRRIYGLAVLDPDGPSPEPSSLHIVADELILRWDGGSLSSVGNGLNSWAEALAVYDEDGDGPEPARLFAAGNFVMAGAIRTSSIAAWDGSRWSSPDGGRGIWFSHLSAVDMTPNLSVLFGGDSLREPLGWDGTSWSLYPNASSDLVRHVAGVDHDGSGPDPTTLYALGSFALPDGAGRTSLAIWDGSTWVPWNSPERDGYIGALGVFDDDGPGPRLPALYVGGRFTMESIAAQGIARWDGTSWSSVGDGIAGEVTKLAPFHSNNPETSAPELYAAWHSRVLPSSRADRVSKWDGTSWTALGDELDGDIIAIAAFDDDGPGPGFPTAYLAGSFYLDEESPPSSLIRWNGASWSEVAGDIQGRIEALAVFDEDGAGPAPPGLVASGDFRRIEGVSSGRIAKWSRPTPTADVNSDGAVSLGDFAAYILCTNDSAANTASHTCCVLDFNFDGRIDLRDFASLQSSFTGP